MTKIKSIVLALSLALFGVSLYAYADSSDTNANTETTGQYMTSSALTAKVKAALLATKGISSTDISVKTYNNTVYLTGVVHSQAESELAKTTAEGVNGVAKVKNQLTVQQ